MTRRLVTAAQEPTWKFCDHCGRELVRFTTVVRMPSSADVPPFEPYQVPVLNPYCAYRTAHERNEEVR